jgi:hypothetical protein
MGTAALRSVVVQLAGIDWRGLQRDDTATRRQHQFFGEGEADLDQRWGSLLG